MSDIKIFVIGSNSFSGASFINFALAKNFSVFGLSRSELPNNVFLPYSDNINKVEKFKFFQLDLNNDLDEIISLINQEKPEYIFQQAYDDEVDDMYTEPTEEDSTRLGKVPQEAEKGSIQPYNIRNYLGSGF